MEKHQPLDTGRLIIVAPSVPGAVPEHPDSAEYQVTCSRHQNGNFWLDKKQTSESDQPPAPGALAAQRAINICQVYVEQAGLPIEDTPL